MNKSDTLETLYDKYGKTVYGIVLKYTSDIPEAERIICEMFKNINLTEINNLRNISVCHFLVSSAIRLVQLEKGELIKKKDSLENASSINKIFFQQKSLDEMCKDNKQSRAELFKDVRMELQLIYEKRKSMG